MDLTRGIPLTPAGLADVPDFRLGETSVCPATRIVSGPGGDKQIEPRVMQVLIALADAQGGVVTRDALLDRCWGGVFVGDDSLNRAIAGIRRVAAGVAGGSFEIETISRTGYRLTVRQAHEIASPTKSRRTMLMGMAAAGSVGAGIAAFYSRGTPAPSASPIAASARQLYRNGLTLRSQGDVEAIGQVEAFFAKAVQTDPQFGEAWAALALARALQVPWEQDATQATIAAQAIFAANRALQIEPDLIEAQAAAALLPSSFRRWADAEASFRRLLGADQKTTYAEWVLRARLALTLGEVGRCEEALQEFRHAVPLYPNHPYASVGLTQALWNAGYGDEAKMESDRALERFPGHSDVWFTRMALLTFSSRPETAIAFGEDRSQLPFRETGEGLIYRRILTARALAELNPSIVEHATRLHLAAVSADREEVPAAARFFAALGRNDIVIDLLRGYFLNEGKFRDAGRPPPGPFTRYATSTLFWPPMAPVWRDPRFPQFVEAIGLTRYWHETGSKPDYMSP